MKKDSRSSTFIFRAAVTTILVVGLAAVVTVIVKRSDPGPQRRSSLDRFQDRVAPGDCAGWNLIVVTLDTVRSDHVGCYGYGPAETPTIDRLAARGAQFDQAVTDVPATLPAHCSIMTGLPAPMHGVRTNGHFRLDDRVTTLAEVLEARGYATAAFVNTYVLNSRFGLDQGFDTYDQFPEPGVSRGHRRADVVTNLAIAWLTDHLRSSPDQPYFAWVHYFDPHAPYDPPGEFGRRFAEAPYDGEIAFTDFHLRRLLDFLDARDQTRRTLIVLTADHGEGLGDHLEPEHSRLIYDTTVHVPLIISCPQLHDAPCRIDDVTVGTIDITPTVLSLLGVETTHEMAGLDLASATISPDRTLYIETLAPLLYHGWSSLHGLRTIDGKYIDAPTPEYYDLIRDPGELDNLLEADPDHDGGLAVELVKIMSRWQSVEAAAARSDPLTKQAARALGALGYVSTLKPGEPVPLRGPDPKDIHPIFEDLRTGSPGEIHEMALAMATSRDGDRGWYRRALILAETAHQRRPHDAGFSATVGIARYRLADYEAALAALDASLQAAATGDAAGRGRAMAFRAMTLARLGRGSEARTELDRLHRVTAGTDIADGDAAIVAEAEAVLTGP